MTPQTIEEIQNQIEELQKSLDSLKNSKLKVTREFSGQYFDLYKGIQYRRMESDGIPIWEYYTDRWIKVNEQETEELEKIYHQDCIILEAPEPPAARRTRKPST